MCHVWYMRLWWEGEQLFSQVMFKRFTLYVNSIFTFIKKICSNRSTFLIVNRNVVTLMKFAKNFVNKIILFSWENELLTWNHCNIKRKKKFLPRNTQYTLEFKAFVIHITLFNSSHLKIKKKTKMINVVLKH